MLEKYGEFVKKMENSNWDILDEALSGCNQKIIKEAHKDEKKKMLLAIDCQNDFMEDGPLGVPKSLKDMERINRFIYNNMPYISEIVCTLDIHSPQQIFFPCWWKDEEGRQPDPYTIITLKDVKEGKYTPIERYSEQTIKYLGAIEKEGKQLCIWPYHCIRGTKGAALEESFAKMVYLHSVLRNTDPVFIEKGKNPFSEQYGFLYPEGVSESTKTMASLSLSVPREFYHEVYIVGEAASHCVLESLKQMLETKLFSVRTKIIVLTDCMSSIPGYEEKTKEGFEKLKEEYGIVLTKSTDVDLYN